MVPENLGKSVSTFFMLAALALILGGPTKPAGAQRGPLSAPPANEAARLRATQMLQSGPPVFVENRGQWEDAVVRFALTGSGVNVGLTSQSLRFQLFRREAAKPGAPLAGGAPPPAPDPAPGRLSVRRAGTPTTPTVTRMKEFRAVLAGARAVLPEGRAASPQRFNFRRGAQSQWRENVPAWESAVYPGLYPGVDLVVSGRKVGMKYEFLLAPGADWKQIQLRYEGLAALRLREDGALELTPAPGWEPLVDGAPVIYQESAGQRQAVAGRFRLVNANTVGFDVTGPYDATRPLVIDPELAWGSFIGGSGIEFGQGVAADSAGNVYVTGTTTSAGWVAGGYDTSLNNSSMDAFVAKFSPAGASLWSTYLGGEGSELGYGVAVDGSGNVYATGFTSSAAWTSGGFNTTPPGAGDAYVVKLAADGSHLWSAVLGGTGEDCGYAIAVDAAGSSVYVAGGTESAGWVSGGSDTSFNSSTTEYYDGFVAKMTASGTALTWSTYLGGLKDDNALGIALDGAGNAYVCGDTSSAGWTAAGYNTAFNGGSSGSSSDTDAFAAKISAAGQVQWTTYLGGSGKEEGRAIAVDSAGNAVVTGYTTAGGWVSGGSGTVFQGGGMDAYVVRLSPAGGHLWSTFLGGGSGDEGGGIALNGAGEIFVAGDTSSADWISGGFQTTLKGSSDAFVAKLTASGAALWSSYVGGSKSEEGNGIACGDAGAVYIAGGSYSPDGMTGGADQVNDGIAMDAFVARVLDNATSQTGALFVTLTPPEAAAAGAQWRRQGAAAWHASATTETGVATGACHLEFKTLPGWVTPAPALALVTRDHTSTATAAYQAAGALQVTLNPPEAVAVGGAQWRRSGTTPWLNSGAVETNLSTGTCTVQFKDIDGWAAPASQTRTILKGQTTQTSGTYTAVQSGLSWSTYLNSGDQFGIIELDYSSTMFTYASSLAVDSSGNVFVCGNTSSSGWVSGGYDTAFGGGSIDAFVVKISPTGQFLWSTYLGGKGSDYAGGIAVSSAGYVYVTGETSSNDWVSGGYDTTLLSGRKAFVAKLSMGGQHVWSTFLGNSAISGYGIAADSAGNAYVTGSSYPHCFVAKVSAAGLDYGFLKWGGDGDEYGRAITFDSSGNIYIVGTTTSSDWMVGGYNTTFHGGPTDAFVVKFSATGTYLWGTYLGGSGEDDGQGITLDADGNIYAVGNTQSAGWVSGGCNTTAAGTGDGFLVKLSTQGAHLWSTYLGGGAWDSAMGVATDSARNVYAAGGTSSAGWLQGGQRTVVNGSTDAYVIKLSSAGTHRWSTAIGGTSSEGGTALAVDLKGNILICGGTYSAGWVSGGFDTTYANNNPDTFVAKLHEFGTLRMTLSPPEAVAAGAQWRPVGTTQWLDSGTTDTTAASGGVTIEFKPVDGWNPPNQQVLTLQAGQSYLYLSASYTRQYGSLSATLAPAAAVTAGARWHRVGTSNWLVSGAQELFVPTGTCILEFLPLAGWDTPTTQSVTVIANQTAVAMATYVRQTGSLGVTITPPAAVAAGARWRRAGTIPWLDSATTETGVPAGGCTVEFNAISGWATPASQSVTIPNGRGASLGATYTVAQAELTWSTYVGGSDIEQARGIAADPDGNVLVCGTTYSAGWVSNGLDTSYGGVCDAFVAKLTPDGQHLWSTYLGGANDDYGYCVAVDGAGNAYASGATNSGEWLTPANGITYHGSGEGFMVKLSPAGSLLWGTFQGGSLVDTVQSVAVDSQDNVLIAGTTQSSGWISGGYDTTYNGGSYDGYAAKFTAAGQPLWSTYLGGGDSDFVYGCAVDGAGDLYVTGTSRSAGWVSGGDNTSLNNGNYNGYLVKISPTGQHLWSTLLGAAGETDGFDVTVDALDNPLVAGYTTAPGWVSGGFDTSLNGSYDAFVAKFSAAGARQWSTYLGGSGDDKAYGIAADGAGSLFVTGQTASSGWVSGGFNATLKGASDAFVCKLSATGYPLWSTCLGGSSNDCGYCLAVRGSTHDIFVAGYTYSSGWVAGGYDTIFSGSEDAFVAKIHDVALAGPTGALRTTLAPAAAVTAGARWRRAGTTAWLASGVTESNLPAGAYQIECKPLAAWAPPALQNVWIPAAQTVQTSGTYTAGGALTVTITPPEAVAAGAQWRRTGTTAWLAGGATEIGLPATTCTVQFKAVAGWIAPPNQACPINANQTTAAGAAYTPIQAELNWSTYLVGSGKNQVNRVVADSTGTIYAVGTTGSAGWVSGGYDTVYGEGEDAFVIKLSPAGRPLWSTYLGGVGVENGNGIALDTAGNVVVCGQNTSDGWVSGPFSEAFHGGYDGFVAKLSPAGQHLWSTSLGDGGEYAIGVAVDAQDNILVTGITATPTWLSRTNNTQYLGGSLDNFVLKLNASGQTLWGVYAGSAGTDFATDIAVDGAGNAYLTGYTTYSYSSAGYVIKLSPAGQVQWNTALGAQMDCHSYCYGIAVDGSGNSAVAGSTDYTHLAAGGWNTTYGGGNSDGFVTRLTPAGQPFWSTFLGGSAAEACKDIALDGTGNIYVTGFTNSNGWLPGGVNGGRTGNDLDAFMLKLSPAGYPCWSACLGGNMDEQGLGIALDGAANVIVGGITASSSWPAGGYQTSFYGTNDGFIAKFHDYQAPAPTGSLKVTINPATLAGTRWRRAGTTPWFGGGATEQAVPPGRHNLEFKPLAGWATPPAQSLWVPAGQTLQTSGTYIGYGTVRVTLSPPDAVAAGARWRRRGSSAWLASGDSDTSTPIGLNTIECKPLTGWRTPASPTVSIAFGKTSQVGAAYDPIPGGFLWSTYAGGDNLDSCADIAVDDAGNSYVTGYTKSSGWVSGGMDTTFHGNRDAFVLKLSPTGQHLWSTCLGGSDDDFGQGIALDKAGNCYVAGYTGSSGWVYGGASTTFGGGYDAFVVKLASGGQHVWSTYVGGTGRELCYDIALDDGGNIYLAGATGSAKWASGGYDTSHGGLYDGFVAKLSPASALLWSTYLGGTGDDYARSLAVRGSDVYVTGYTASTGWVAGGFDTVYGGATDAFVVKLTTAGARQWSTYLGGGGADAGYGLALDSGGNAWITGTTASAGWVAGDLNSTLRGDSDGFAVKLSPDGQSLWSTYLGGDGKELGYAVAVDSADNVYLTGSTSYNDWLSGGFDTTGSIGYAKAYVVKLSPTGSHLWSTLVGANGSNCGYGLAANIKGYVYLVGDTTAATWTSGGFQTTFGGATDGFAARLLDGSAGAVGSLHVTMAPAAVAAAAHWRRVGTTAWLSSGQTEIGLPIGDCQVEFSDVLNWNKPANLGFTIEAGVTASQTGVYTSPLEVSLQTSPVMARKPGQSASISVTVKGVSPITLQWLKNGVPIPGASGTTYQIGTCRTADTGCFTCRANNAYASAISPEVQLVVNNGGAVISYLLGLSSDESGLDLNSDKRIDISDALRGLWDTPPDVPSAPFPASGTPNLGLLLRLNWADCGNNLHYDLYLWPGGTSRPAKPTATGLTLSQYDVTSGLEHSMTYQWQVIAVGARFSVPGPVWTFQTN